VPLNAPPLSHRVIAANVHAVPEPFRSFAVRSDEPQHACDARAPYAWVHIVRTAFLDAASLARLAAAGDARVSIEAFSDIDYATTTTLPELAAAVPHVSDLAGHIASALQLTGVLGGDLADYRRSVATRIDYLAARGAGIHNDVNRGRRQLLHRPHFCEQARQSSVEGSSHGDCQVDGLRPSGRRRS
jgi:hypothetical protein